MLSTDNIYFSPRNVFKHYTDLFHKVGKDAVEDDSKYKRVRETKAAAYLAVALTLKTGKPHWLKVIPDNQGSPDLELMWLGKSRGVHEFLMVEVTRYDKHSNSGLIDFLKNTKLSKIKINSYSDKFVVLIDISKNVTFEPLKTIHEEIKKLKPKFAVVAVGQLKDSSNIAVLNLFPKLSAWEFNLDQQLKENKYPNVVQTVLGVKNAGKFSPRGKFPNPPWGLLIS